MYQHETGDGQQPMATRCIQQHPAATSSTSQHVTFAGPKQARQQMPSLDPSWPANGSKSRGSTVVGRKHLVSLSTLGTATLRINFRSTRRGGWQTQSIRRSHPSLTRDRYAWPRGGEGEGKGRGRWRSWPLLSAFARLGRTAAGGQSGQSLLHTRGVDHGRWRPRGPKRPREG